MSLKLLQHSGFISLILRSEDSGDGWRKVTPVLERFAHVRIAADPSLYESRTVEGVLQIRLSDKGKILAEYI